jgi:hypothetical protein
MSNWTATNELRFVERSIKGKWIGDYYGEPMYESRVVRILQQKWKHNEASYYGGRIVSEEWRDVPVVEEE